MIIPIPSNQSVGDRADLGLMATESTFCGSIIHSLPWGTNAAVLG